MSVFLSMIFLLFSLATFISFVLCLFFFGEVLGRRAVVDLVGILMVVGNPP